MKPDDKRAEKFAIEIGRLIRDTRKELGMTQTTLARHVGVSQQQVVKYEKGVGRIPAEKLSALAELLKIDPGVLFYPLAMSQPASFGGFAETGGGRHSGFADSGAPYLADTTADLEVAQLLRDFLRIRDAEARRSILQIISTVAAKSEAASPPRGRKRR